jgi:hypothetical protein
MKRLRAKSRAVSERFYALNADKKRSPVASVSTYDVLFRIVQSDQNFLNDQRGASHHLDRPERCRPCSARTHEGHEEDAPSCPSRIAGVRPMRRGARRLTDPWCSGR